MEIGSLVISFFFLFLYVKKKFFIYFFIKVKFNKFIWIIDEKICIKNTILLHVNFQNIKIKLDFDGEKVLKIKLLKVWWTFDVWEFCNMQSFPCDT